jgi:Tol biopolymer transport system component
VLSPGTATPTFDPGDVTPVEEATDTPPPTEVTEAAPTETTEAGVPSETPADPAASETPAADQTFIAYVLDGQLLVTDVTGGVLGGTTQYTQPGVDDGVTDLVWSPSGEFIAYTGLVGDAQHIFVVYAEGAGTPVDLGQGAIAAWSPDSTQLAYQNQGQLWLTTVEAPAPVQLTHQDNWAWGRPAWRPDGLGLVVSGEAFDDMGASGNTTFFFYSLPLDGSGTLTPLPGMTAEAEGRLPYDLEFSPDGTKLAFSTSWHLSACASLGSYYVANNDGSNLQAVTSPALAAVANEDDDDYFAAFGYAWRPDSAALLISGLVRDCTDFAGTVLAAQMSQVTLDGAESMIVSGQFAPVSVNNAGTLIGTTFDEGSGTGQVQLYDLTGALVLEVGEGNMATVQP